jgi:hypothetical protein
MTTFAHAGHWLAQVAYLAPLVLLVGLLVAGRIRERRGRQEALAQQHPRASNGGAVGRSDATESGPDP